MNPEFQLKQVTAAEARAIAKEAFLWSPSIAMYQCVITMQNEKSPRFTGISRLSWYRKPLTASDRFATTPSATTLYGQQCSTFRRTSGAHGSGDQKSLLEHPVRR